MAEAETWHPYAFVSQNPYVARDPSGERKLSELMMVLFIRAKLQLIAFASAIPIFNRFLAHRQTQRVIANAGKFLAAAPERIGRFQPWGAKELFGRTFQVDVLRILNPARTHAVGSFRGVLREPRPRY